MVDLLASEYGWSIGTILALPADQINELTHAILYRRGVKTIRRAMTVEPEISLAERMKTILDTAQDTDAWQKD